MRTRRSLYLLRITFATGILIGGCVGNAQQTADSAGLAADGGLRETVRDLQEQVRDLKAAIVEMRAENQQTHAEAAQLRQLVNDLRREQSPKAVTLVNASSGSTEGAGAGMVAREQAGDEAQPDSSASPQEQYDLLSGKVDDQYQTKVESASKYRMRLSGIVLLNLFSNRGTVNNIDVPTLAYVTQPGFSRGSTGATVRQSQIGFEVFGPSVGGARTRGDLQLDFGGGFQTAANGVNAGLVRLRTATMRLDWENTSIVAGQDSLFFSPGAPTSFASLIVPALTYSGNLWGWVPQVRVEHRVSVGERSAFTFQGGIVEALSGEAPAAGPYRTAGPSEASRQPGFGSRVGWTHSLFGQPLNLGFGGFYGRQNYGFARNLDAWAGTADAELPLSHGLFLSGKLYRGRGLGGLYGGTGRSVLFSGDPANPSSELLGLNTVGGWAQLKYQATSKLEFNTAFGLDNPYARDLNYFPYSQSYGNTNPNLSRNLGGFANVIFRPRSDLLFSAEYRHLKTYTINYAPDSADHVNLMMGVLF